MKRQTLAMGTLAAILLGGFVSADEAEEKILAVNARTDLAGYDMRTSGAAKKTTSLALMFSPSGFRAKASEDGTARIWRVGQVNDGIALGGLKPLFPPGPLLLFCRQDAAEKPKAAPPEKSYAQGYFQSFHGAPEKRFGISFMGPAAEQEVRRRTQGQNTESPETGPGVKPAP